MPPCGELQGFCCLNILKKVDETAPFFLYKKIGSARMENNRGMTQIILRKTTCGVNDLTSIIAERYHVDAIIQGKEPWMI